MNSVLELARRDRLITINPARDITAPSQTPERVGVALDDEQMGRVLASAESIDPATAPMVMLMVRCGLRIGEAMALRWRHVDLDTSTIRLSESMSRNEGVRPLKSRDRIDERVIPIPEDVTVRLQTHRLSQAPGTDDLLFSSPNGQVIRYTNWRRRVWARIVEDSGVECKPHDLRRTTATRLFRTDGWSPPEVQAYLGHRDPRMTLKVYTKVNPSSLPQPSTL
jgi:integrase